jgi:hypothetical protein
VSEDLDTKRQNKRGRRTRKSWWQQGKRRRDVETFEGEGVEKPTRTNLKPS